MNHVDRQDFFNQLLCDLGSFIFHFFLENFSTSEFDLRYNPQKTIKAISKQCSVTPLLILVIFSIPKLQCVLFPILEALLQSRMRFLEI